MMRPVMYDRVGLCVTCIIWVVIVICPSSSGVLLPPDVRNECRGTSDGLNDRFASDYDKRLDHFRELYDNCTDVTLNLEITHFRQVNNSDPDLSFFENIRDVHGYVLIASNVINRIPLTSLRIIRGLVLYTPGINLTAQGVQTSPALYVAGNRHENVGLTELQLPALREILRGGAIFKDNPLLCYDGQRNINWTYILPPDFKPHYIGEQPSTCEPRCDANCSMLQEKDRRGLCWGPSREMCQQITRLNCHEICQGKCFGPGEGQCCDGECAGGCHGPGNSKCWACRSFVHDGKCEKACPPYQIYHSELHQWLPNPNVKYAYGTKCLDKCPTNMNADKGACVSTCGPGRTVINGTCEQCAGICPRTCPGTDGGSSVNGYVNDRNIDSFKDCTVIEGSLDFTAMTFQDDEWHNHSALSVHKLEVFKDVQEIRDYLKVSSTVNVPQLRTLTFLRNLKTIKGQRTAGGANKASLLVSSTSLEYLGLQSLSVIESGNVVIANNKKLCFAQTIVWTRVFKPPQTAKLLSNTCGLPNALCSERCWEDGCWGPGDDQCLTCKDYRHNVTKRCLTSCDEEPRLYVDNSTKECRPCDEQCKTSCTGAGPSKCDACKFAKDGPYCVAKCPPSKYRDENGVCKECHVNCKQGDQVDDGCTGPKPHLGYGGCNQCAGLLLDHNIDGDLMDTECLNGTLKECEKGLYFAGGTIEIPTSEGGSEDRLVLQMCRQCDAQCESCKKEGPSCEVCKSYRQQWNRQCIDDCSKSDKPSYMGPSKGKELGLCLPCHRECAVCDGPSHINCTTCVNRKIYVPDLLAHGEELLANYSVSENDTVFCAASCPDVMSSVYVEGNGQTVCSDPPEKVATGAVAGIVAGLCAIIAIAAAILGTVYFRRQWAKTEERKLRLRAQISGFASEPDAITPSNAKPDMSSMRLCKESELKRGEIIGSGAFGTVYKGVFIPERENIKIPVAIKELSESSNPDSSSELLEEARIMATVVHPCCIRIMAVCMTKQMMLVTPLMPYGSMLDYIRRNRANVGSHAMLTWAKQIAEGMSYLESVGIVHRDLAARNVLVHSTQQVRITDFGLAKLLDCNEESYQATGGKLPIKWLALESIQYRRFTHKSDVWSYGVTLWELFTYGERPFDDIKAMEMAKALERGQRLPQPTICTIDVYMLMIKCWMVDADNRPTFAELFGEFSKMSKDPQRYLVIHNDGLMRQPSVAPDARELLRGMSITSDGSELFVNADDYYLQPRELESPQRQLDAIDEENYENTSAPHVTFGKDTCGAEGNDAWKGGRRQVSNDYNSGTSVRYTKDPCDEVDAWPSVKPPAAPKVLQPNTDDDGYLATATMVAPQTDEAGYLPVVDDCPKKDPVPTSSPGNQYLDMTTPAAGLSDKRSGPGLSNPEYFAAQPAPHSARPNFFPPGRKAWLGGGKPKGAEYLNA